MKTTFRIAAIVVLFAAVWFVLTTWRHSPPYEIGIHDTVIQAQNKESGSAAARIGGCAIFPADNVWNTPVDRLRKDPHSQDYIDAIGPMRTMHPDFGSNLQYGVPYSIIASDTRQVPVTFDYAEQSDTGRYPIPADAPIEGGPSSTDDRHVILIDSGRCLLYELWNAHPQKDGSWQAGSGAKFDLTDNALRPEGWTSADAAGLPVLPGLVRYEEVASGTIQHALRFTVPHTQNAFVWPARHKSSNNSDQHLPPMGLRFRLRSDFDVSRFSAQNQVLLVAMKRYGLILADNGGALFISGVSDKRWSDSDLHKLNAVKMDDFEVVDESGLELMPNSGRVDPIALKQLER